MPWSGFALHSAGVDTNWRLVSTLLNQGIEIDATNHNGEWALYLAAVNCNEQLVSRSLLNRVRCLSSAELFRFYKVVEGKGKGRPDMQDRVREMLKLLDLGREKGKREKVPKEAGKPWDKIKEVEM